ncbi:uncharacterized protein LOC143424446 [Xylocopa sonorina]|uniref:uncharacterized protein LOC143424446 n=1 Tax=Xylocopa sonorina TaxID=1818115 RepID=UPI00403B1097
MNFLIIVFLTIGVSYNRIHYEVKATTRDTRMIQKSLGTSTTRHVEIETPQRQISWTDSTQSSKNSDKLQQLGRNANAKPDYSLRRSKILRSLAFLAGLSVGDLAGAASSGVKTYSKLPLNVNVGATRISPQIPPALYEPYPYLMNPYIFPPPLGFYPLWNALRLQTISGLQNHLQSLSQSAQPLNLLDNNNEYTDEAQRIENIKTSNGDSENTGEKEVENDLNGEEKLSIPGSACNIRKSINTKQIDLTESSSAVRENAGGPASIQLTRIANATNQPVATNTTQMPNANSTTEVTNSTTMSSVQNSTMTTNQTTQNPNQYPPFYGYYGGYPQNINHIDLTTETYQHKYHDYEHINYHIPSYDRPVNFYADERYNYYPISSVDAYPATQFHQEQIPEYLPSDINRFVYTSDNTPPFANSEFRPVA